MPARSAEMLRTLADAFNARDFDRARDMLSNDMEFTDLAAGVTTHGRDGFIEYARAWAGAFSDMQLETRALVGDETHAAGEFVGRGTHDGTLPMPTGEVLPTGRKFEEPFTWFADVADGKISGIRDYYNAMSFMTQLGLMPEAAETAP